MSSDRDVSLGKTQAGVARATITLGFMHPTMDPAEITERLRLTPTGTRKVGDRLVGIDGKVRRNIERQTKWVLRKKYYEPESSSDDGDEPPFDVNGHLDELVEPLLRERDFVRQVAAAGAASIDIGLPGQRYMGFVVDPHILAKIGDLGLGLGIEVFPDSAT